MLRASSYLNVFELFILEASFNVSGDQLEVVVAAAYLCFVKLLFPLAAQNHLEGLRAQVRAAILENR